MSRPTTCLKVYFILLVVVCLLAGNSYAGTNRRAGIALGINTLQIKYGLSDKWKVAANLAYEDYVFIIGGRVQRQKGLADSNVVFAGIDANWINFNTESILGKGYMLYLPLGLEQFATSKFSVTAEIGPAYVFLKSNSIDVSQSGVDWMWNVYLTFYLGKEVK